MEVSETKEFHTHSAEETGKLASELLVNIQPNHNGAYVIGLYGDLGAGKTTFMKALGAALGIKETIQSPTFVIEKIYELENMPFKHLIHIDAYRIDESSELINLGWNEIIADNKNIICIEWPERVEDIMPKHTKIIFEHIEENKRKITIN